MIPLSAKLVDNLDKAVEVTKPEPLYRRMTEAERIEWSTIAAIDCSKWSSIISPQSPAISNPAQKVLEDANRAAQYISSNNSNVQADFNFYGSITKEAIPQLEKKIDDAIYELKKEIPKIASEGQRSERRRFGSNW